MGGGELIRATAESLSLCAHAMDELEAKCCDPGRSPRMASLRSTLAETTRLLKSLDGQTTTAMDVIEQIESAGAQLGALQVTCCAASRMPLYDTLFHILMEIQRAVTRYAELAEQ